MFTSDYLLGKMSSHIRTDFLKEAEQARKARFLVILRRRGQK